MHHRRQRGHQPVVEQLLGLTTHPKIMAAAKRAIDTHGVGTAAVRTIIGTMDLHQELEERLAKFKHTEATLTFQSGFTSNQGIIQALMEEGDAIISDELNHASIIDGIRLSKAGRFIFQPRRHERPGREAEGGAEPPHQDYYHGRRVQHGR